eukprot:TRINITY_DN39733_c0_g1_i1.p1 TRINITY_DN39733_c0_g1~~TRINITY_DN39733_c0_g1_i1.p1  ORF type:complete len:270 (+),score=37.11 TRINITY_DN39733_c0_g1_i1:218-1027(+)
MTPTEKSLKNTVAMLNVLCDGLETEEETLLKQILRCGHNLCFCEGEYTGEFVSVHAAMDFLLEPGPEGDWDALAFGGFPPHVCAAHAVHYPTEETGKGHPLMVQLDTDYEYGHGETSPFRCKHALTHKKKWEEVDTDTILVKAQEEESEDEEEEEEEYDTWSVAFCCKCRCTVGVRFWYNERAYCGKCVTARPLIWFALCREYTYGVFEMTSYSCEVMEDDEVSDECIGEEFQQFTHEASELTPHVLRLPSHNGEVSMQFFLAGLMKKE